MHAFKNHYKVNSFGSWSSLEDIFSDPIQFERMFGIPLSCFQESDDLDCEEEEEEALDDMEQLLSASGLQNDIYLQLSHPLKLHWTTLYKQYLKQCLL